VNRPQRRGWRRRHAYRRLARHRLAARKDCRWYGVGPWSYLERLRQAAFDGHTCWYLALPVREVPDVH
jgi:hypothetical protein